MDSGQLLGGQAVLEGVMMRSSRSLAVAVRRADGSLTVRESPWRKLAPGRRFLRWPFLRGGAVLVESLMNGMAALNFSARLALEDEESRKGENGDGAPPPEGKKAGRKSSDVAAGLTVALGIVFGVGLFIALPHLAVWLGSSALGRELGVRDFLFHAVTGAVKFLVFVGYIAAISLFSDVRKVFAYHGAEHQSIHALEAGQPLDVASARAHSPLHPRCGTTFLILVIAMSILVFSLVFPPLLWWLGEPTGIGWLDQIIYILIKLPLLVPVAGLAYELQRITARRMDRAWARALAAPGLLLQRLTTRRASDDQLETALAALHKCLWRDRRPAGEEIPAEAVERHPSYQAFLAALEKNG